MNLVTFTGQPRSYLYFTDTTEDRVRPQKQYYAALYEKMGRVLPHISFRIAQP